ncbi:hypothetical protein HWV62_42918 [Athelia sp. TMB]|nr:hypothetical protein HWV62_42918 [Athelia sp. TMB]
MPERALREAVSGTAIRQIDDFVSSFASLKHAFDFSVVVQTGQIVNRALVRAEVVVQQQMLDALKPAKMDLHGRPECLPGTRLDILKIVVDWATNPAASENVFWLSGVAGSGKSTLTTSIAKLFRDINCLGAFLFFNRDIAESSEPSNVVRTIAYQLGQHDRKIGDAISTVIEATPTLIRGNSQLQFSKLLVEPLSSLSDYPHLGPIVIVLDAIDECGTPDSRRSLMRAIAIESAKLPPIFRFLIVGRPEHDIRQHLDARSHIRSYRLRIDSDATRDDILTMLRSQLSIIRSELMASGPKDWPGEARLRALASRASGLFVWASTAAKFLQAQDPEHGIQIILAPDGASDAQTALDNLYTKALQSVGRWSDAAFSSGFREVVGTLLVARNPMSGTTIDKLLHMEQQKTAFHAISRLGCLFYSNAIIRFLHPSFADFLSDHERCQNHQWFIDLASHNLRVAVQCMDRLRGVLRYNLCALSLSRESSSWQGRQLPEDAVYTCIFWVEHVCAVENGEAIAPRLEQFVFEHLLHWLEAMSILGRARSATTMLKSLLSWYQKRLPPGTRLHNLIYDAYRFTQTYVEFIEAHPMAIYTAALPFTPTNTVLYQTFHNKKQHPLVSVGCRSSWPSMLSVLPGPADRVRHVAFAARGERIVTSTFDNLLCLWDVESGVEACLPFPHESESQDLVTFSTSEDGALIASVNSSLDGNRNRSVSVYDTSSREPVAGPFDVGEGPFKMVLLSPKGDLLASVAGNTLFIWDIASSALISERASGDYSSLAFLGGQLFCGSSSNGSVIVHNAYTGEFASIMTNGHTSTVIALHAVDDSNRIFSIDSQWRVCAWDAPSGNQLQSMQLLQSDGKACLASFSLSAERVAVQGSNEFGVWDVETGSNICKFSNTDTVCSLALSPNGNLVVAASTIRMAGYWSVADSTVRGIVAPESLRPRGIQVDSLIYSPNGDRIALTFCDSNDRIHIIDATTGNDTLHPLECHTPVKSMAFSPNSFLLASGSEDCKLRVWNSENGSEWLTVSSNHQDHVMSVEFSRDGGRLLSTSRDFTVRVWSLESGTELLAITIPRKRKILSAAEYAHPCAAMSPDGLMIVTSSEYGDDICLWDATTGLKINLSFEKIPFEWRRSPSLGFSSDSRSIFLKSSKSSRREWDVNTGTLSEESRPGSYTGKARDEIVVDSRGGWIMENDTKRTLSRLPFTTAAVVMTTSCRTSIAIVTQDDFLVVRFPTETL